MWVFPLNLAPARLTLHGASSPALAPAHQEPTARSDTGSKQRPPQNQCEVWEELQLELGLGEQEGLGPVGRRLGDAASREHPGVDGKLVPPCPLGAPLQLLSPHS